MDTCSVLETKSLEIELSDSCVQRAEWVDPAHAYLADRGISKHTAKRFGVGFYSGYGPMSGRIVIPIENESGEWVADAGRSLPFGI